VTSGATHQVGFVRNGTVPLGQTVFTDEEKKMSTTVADLRKKTPLKEVMKQPPKQRIATLLAENKKEIMAALPEHVSKERLLMIAQTAATSNPKLLECYTPSLFGALIKCTQLGLEPNNALGEAYLVPFKNNKANRLDCQLIIGYRGLQALARRSGQVNSIMANHVCEKDTFEWEYGLEEKLRHIPAHGDRGAITYFYAYSLLKDGGHQFVVWTNDEMIHHMKTQTQSRGEYGPWADNYLAMGSKTMVRMLAKWLPQSINLAEAVSIDARADVGMNQGLEDVLSGDYTVVPDQDPEALPEPLTDANGEIFDEKIHQQAEGEPAYKKDGTFKMKVKKKRAAAAKPAAQEPVHDEPADEPEEEQEEEEEEAEDYSME
jgi:recombination protein RecT